MPHEGNQDGRRPQEDVLLRGLRQLAIDPQEEVPADLHARVMARAAAGPQPRLRRRAWLRMEAPAWALPALATGLVLSLALNVVWLSSNTLGPHSPGLPVEVPTHGSTDRSGRIRLAFVDNVREQELRMLLLSLRATIIRGPSPQGVYIVQVPLPRLRLRGTEEPNTADPLRLLLEELRMHPAVRLAEPVSPSE